MAQVKLRPLVIHDPASSQPSLSDACAPEASQIIRTHTSLPITSRGKPLAPAPPETGKGAASDNGVSKLRNKLRRLLGAHGSNSQARTSTKPSTPPSSHIPNNTVQRCASAADFPDHHNHRGPTSPISSALPSRIPNGSVAPSPPPPSRGRFHSSNALHVPPAVSSPSTPVSNPPNTNNSSSRAGTPATPGTGSGSANATPRGSNTSSAALRRAVSFSPAATTFPPLTPHGPQPQPPAGMLSPTRSSASDVTVWSAGSGSMTMSSSSINSGSGPRGAGSSSAATSFSSSARGSMIVVPEDEALSEEHTRSREFYLSASATLSRSGPIEHSAGLRSSNSAKRISTPAGAESAGISAVQHLPADSTVTPNPAIVVVHPSEPRRMSSSSSSSTNTTTLTTAVASSNGYVTYDISATAASTGGSGGGVGSSASPAAGHLVVTWASDIPTPEGPFATSNTAIVALSDTTPHSPPPTLSPSSSMTPASRSVSFKSATRGDHIRRPSSPSNQIRVSTPQSPSPPHYPHLTTCASTPQTPTATSIQPGSLAVGSLLANPAVIGALTRGVSALHLMPGASNSGRTPASPAVGAWGAGATAGGGGGGSINHTSGPQVQPQYDVVQSGSSGVVSAANGGENAAGAAAKPAPIRRAFSTLDNSSRTAQEGPSTPAGHLLALGASLPSEMQRNEWRLEDFTLLKKLYKGNYSSVHKALCRVSMRLVVIKVYDTTRMTELARNHVRREAALHAPLSHHHILNLFAVFSQGPYVMLVEEVAEGGDLYHVLKGVQSHRLQEDRAVAGVLVPLLRALSYLHEQGICHRDIKLENILFSDRQHTRMLLADFGIALSLRQERAVTRAGTTEYMSPEQLRCPFKRHPGDNKDRTDLHYGLGVDVWATGVLAFELLHGYPPFLGASREETEALIIEAEVQVAPQLSSGARDFILLCLQKCSSERPTVPRLLQHPWIRQHMRPLRAGH